MKFQSICLAMLAPILLILVGCVPNIPGPTEVTVPEPIEGSTGEFMCPYTSDGTVAKWVENGTAAGTGAAIGEAVGNKLFENIPFFGGMLGKAAGRKAALELVGGEEFMKETSDLSFMRIKDLIVYIYANYSDNEHYQEVYDLSSKIYPDMQEEYVEALEEADSRPNR
jgi:hypothetical protein